MDELRVVEVQLGLGHNDFKYADLRRGDDGRLTLKVDGEERRAYLDRVASAPDVVIISYYIRATRRRYMAVIKVGDGWHLARRALVMGSPNVGGVTVMHERMSRLLFYAGYVAFTRSYEPGVSAWLAEFDELLAEPAPAA